jgi:putative transposase
MIDRSHDLPVTRQAVALGISRGSVYYLPRPVAASDLVVMRRIDELHLNFPFAGSRMLRDLLAGEGFAVGRLHVSTLMKRMGIEALYRRPSTSKPAPGHKIYPYLLRKLAVTRPDQVWAMDITYIPMARGFVYLTAVVDWFSRRVLAWHSASRRWRKRCRVTAHRRSSTPIRAVSSPAPSSPAHCSPRASRSAWTAKGRGVTTCSSSGCGER